MNFSPRVIRVNTGNSDIARRDVIDRDGHCLDLEPQLTTGGHRRWKPPRRNWWWGGKERERERKKKYEMNVMRRSPPQFYSPCIHGSKTRCVIRTAAPSAGGRGFSSLPVFFERLSTDPNLDWLLSHVFFFFTPIFVTCACCAVPGQRLLATMH